MIFSVTGSDPADLLPEFREQPRSFVDPTQAFLNQLQGVSQKVEPPKLSTSLKSILITPSATWTTSEMTTSYITTVTHTETSKVPILLRGQRVCTKFKSLKISTQLNYSQVPIKRVGPRVDILSKSHKIVGFK